MEHFYQNLTKMFLRAFSTSLRCSAKRYWKSRVFAWRKLWIYWLFEKQRYEVLAFFDDSCEQIWISKAFVDIATARRHRGVSTIYIKHNLFHQSKLWRDTELRNTHTVRFKSPRDVMQAITLNTHLGKLIQKYLTGIEMQRLFPLLICWLICCHAQTIDYVIVQTPDPFPQNCTSRTGWNSQKFWTMNTQNLSTLQVFQSCSHKCKNHFLQSCPREFIRFLCECIINLLNGNLQSIKRQHVTKFRSKVWLLSPKLTTRKQRRDILASERGLQLIKNITPPVINHLSWYGAVCPCSCFCFCVQEKLD